MWTVSGGLLAVVFTTIAVARPLHAQRTTNVLTLEEIERAKLMASTAYDVVQQLRPRWFATRDREPIRVPGTPGEPLQGSTVRIWMNAHFVGDVDYLKTIPADRVLEMRWYSQNEAVSRFGPTNDPVIEVALKR
jgi:acyl-coenzyme A synthetase/AMP-(fatty) acid ligase